MKIVVNFLDGAGSDYWQQKILQSAEVASALLSSAEMQARLRSHPTFDDCDKTPAQVADLLAATDQVVIHVGFYSKCLTRAIAYEVPSGVYFNTRKEAYGAGSPGNVAHETLHALGFVHNGNAAAGNQNTVPYWAGNEVDEMADSG